MQMSVLFKGPDDVKQKLELHHTVYQLMATVQFENKLPLP